MQKCFVIVNKVAGRGAAQRGWPLIRAALQGAGAHFEMAETEAPGHATTLAREATRAGWSHLIAVGGDGTIHEVVNGMLQEAGDAPAPVLGIIPLGTGNDLAKPLGLPLDDFKAATQRILQGRERAIDIGMLDGRYFANGVGIGFDAQVAVEAAEIGWLRGKAVYLVALLKALRRHQTPTVTIELDGQVQRRAITLLAVSNGPSSGGGFLLSPQARLDDGVFDLCIAHGMGIAQILRFVPQVMQGKHTGRPEVTMARARDVTVRSETPFPVHVDGEVYATNATALTIRLLPGRLRVLG